MATYTKGVYATPLCGHIYRSYRCSNRVISVQYGSYYTYTILK